MTSKTPDIAIVGGAGHVGLPLAVSLAGKGRRVLIEDVNTQALERVARGIMPFIDLGAEPMLKDALKKGLLSFSSDPAALKGVPAIIITIGTPVDGFLNPQIRDMIRCIDDILPYLSDDQTIILRSTVYPGTTDWLDRHLKSAGKRTKVAFCPERVTQGFAIQELQELPQIVSGTTPEAEREAAEIFALCAPEVVRLSPMEAEFSKLFINTYRYILFAIANQFYTLVDSAGLDYYRIIEAMKKNYPRARDIPGAGFAAGPCLFKDTMQLVAFSGNKFNLGQAAMLVNEGLPFYVVETIAKRHDLSSTTIGILGMAFKADSDDPRSSLSYKLKKLLEPRAKRVLTTDPFVREDRELKPLDLVVAESDVLVVGAPHTAYKSLDLGGKDVVDVWNCVGRRASRRLAPEPRR